MCGFISISNGDGKSNRSIAAYCGMHDSRFRRLEMSAKLLSYAPRALRAERAAAYFDMGKTKFLELVGAGKLPTPVEIDGIKVWDRLELDEAFDRFRDELQRRNSFDVIVGSKKT